MNPPNTDSDELYYACCPPSHPHARQLSGMLRVPLGNVLLQAHYLGAFLLQ